MPPAEATIDTQITVEPKVDSIFTTTDVTADLTIAEICNESDLVCDGP